jgi:hypothetical protein
MGFVSAREERRCARCRDGSSESKGLSRRRRSVQPRSGNRRRTAGPDPGLHAQQRGLLDRQDRGHSPDAQQRQDREQSRIMVTIPAIIKSSAKRSCRQHLQDERGDRIGWADNPAGSSGRTQGAFCEFKAAANREATTNLNLSSPRGVNLKRGARRRKLFLTMFLLRSNIILDCSEAPILSRSSPNTLPSASFQARCADQ